MRKKRLVWNSVSSLVLQIVTLISGFIIPPLIIGNFGSEVNGLVNSITQFIQFITLLEMGIGAVIQSALYEPLAKRDNAQISRIMVSGQKFFTVIARILIIYILILMMAYPLLVSGEFGWTYTASLIAISSISSLAQYYFGAINGLLLTADQRGYIRYGLSSLTIIFNTIASYILLKLGFGIHVVKLSTSVIYLVRPILLQIYVNKHYRINRKIKYEEEPLTQKWNGVAQHIAAIVLENTDTVVLTIFSTLSNVSIYSVYHLVIYGVKRIFDTITDGVMSLMGELWAKKELDELTMLFSYTEWLIHTSTVLMFGCVSVLICPFISVYTKGISDVDYIVPTFALVLTIAHATHCLRMPYNIMILAGNQFKQTQINYIVAAILNLGISILCVHYLGLVGVAIGTLVAMAYQTIWMAIYVSKNLLKWPIRNFIKQILVDAGSFICAYSLTKGIAMRSVTYASWILLAIKDALIWLILVLAVNWFFYRSNISTISKRAIRLVKK